MDSSQDLTPQHHHHYHQHHSQQQQPAVIPQKKKSIKIVDLPFVYNNNNNTTSNNSMTNSREEAAAATGVSYRTRIDYALNGSQECMIGEQQQQQQQQESPENKPNDDLWTYRSHAHRIFSHECLPPPDVVVVVENEPQQSSQEQEKEQDDNEMNSSLPPPPLPLMSSPPTTSSNTTITHIQKPDEIVVSEACFRTSSVQIPNESAGLNDESYEVVRGGEDKQVVLTAAGDDVLPEIAKIDEALEDQYENINGESSNMKEESKEATTLKATNGGEEAIVPMYESVNVENDLNSNQHVEMKGHEELNISIASSSNSSIGSHQKLKLSTHSINLNQTHPVPILYSVNSRQKKSSGGSSSSSYDGQRKTVESNFAPYKIGGAEKSKSLPKLDVDKTQEHKINDDKSSKPPLSNSSSRIVIIDGSRMCNANNCNQKSKSSTRPRFESVKQLKKLWESESELANNPTTVTTTSGSSKSTRNLNLSDAVKSFNEFKKWSSMQQISPSPQAPPPPTVPITMMTTPPLNILYDSNNTGTQVETIIQQNEDINGNYEEIKSPPPTPTQSAPPPPPPPMLLEPAVDNETRSNMSNVLEEIKRFDHANKNRDREYLMSKPKRIELDKILMMTTTTTTTTAAPVGHNSRVDQSRAHTTMESTGENSHLVKKLKQKFDNKDQSFIKVASLTCRNASLKDTGSGRNKLPNSNRPTMLSVCENSSSFDLKTSGGNTNDFDMISSTESRRAASTSLNSSDRLNEEIIKKYKEKKTRSISSSSSSSSYGSSFVGMGGGYVGAFCAGGVAGGGGGGGGLFSCGVSSTSSTTATPTNTVTSGLGSSDHSCMNGPIDVSSSASRPYYLKHVITSRKSFNREIKSLLDIAENKTRVLCKVYDSSMSEECNVNPTSERSLIRTAKDQNALLSKDYRKIIDMNYSNLRKKQSNVLNKVKLWDQLLESGSLNIASWGKNFFEFS